MAYELNLASHGLLPAAVTHASNQYKCGKINTAGKIALCDTDGEPFDGVIQNNPVANQPTEMMMMGITKVIAAETLAAGDTWGTDASGLAKKIEATVTGADVGDFVAGRVIEGGAVNEVITVTIGFPQFRVEAQ